MTVFLATLFLPYTVYINPEKTRNSSPQAASQAKYEVTESVTPLHAPLADKLRQKTTQPGRTPGATTDHELIFSASLEEAQVERSGYPFPPTTTPGNQPIESEPRPPAVGAATSLHKAKPQGDPSSSASVLKHADPVLLGREPLSQENFAKQPRPSSRRSSSSGVEWTIMSADHGNGGLFNAVRSAKELGYMEEMMWVGTLGMPTDSLTENTRNDIAEKFMDEHVSLPVFSKDSDFDGHYNHFCKAILWPVFHYQIPDSPNSKAYEDHSWIYYVQINLAFADRIAKNWKPGDSIWVEDYHLMLVPAMLRKMLPDAQIGFFLHSAFPSSEVFKCLAPRRELLEGVLGANLIGFQTDEYCRHFLQTCSRLLCVEATNEGVQMADRFVNVGTFPIGIDLTSWDKRRREADVVQWVATISELYKGKRLVVSRDKIDSVRGIRQKLLSYELFLNTYPGWADKVVLIQVATPSATEEPELEAAIYEIVMRINSVHSTLAHQPLVFLKQDMAFPQYLALITVADALLITSLREGMNLTSHEFVYCQDGSFGDKKYGSLILSEFTGSASVFGNHALLVNPWDYRQCGEAIHTALIRDEKTRKAVWKNLHRAVLQNSTTNWVTSFKETLRRVWSEHSSRKSTAVPRLSVPQLVQRYRQTKRRLILIDYEGTLASWGSPSSIILTTPQRAIIRLTELTEDPANTVYLMSSQTPEQLEHMFRHVNKLGLIAENGCFTRTMDSEEWTCLVDKEQVQSWKTSVASVLVYFKNRVEGSWIEERNCSLVFHYENMEDNGVTGRLIAECADHINDAYRTQGVHVIPIEGALTVEHGSTNKASAAELAWKRCMNEETAKPDFVLVIGDNREDEPVFRWANQLQNSEVVDHVMTITLGARSTEAKATLTQGVSGVLSCLQELASSPEATLLPAQ